MNSTFFKNEQFEAYGLSKDKKWPIACDRINGQAKIKIEGNRDDRYKFMTEKLKTTSFSSCALFAHALDGSLCSVVKTNMGDKICYFTDEQDEYENIYAFRDVAEYFKLKNYALIIQISMREWIVVEE